ncbi:MAG: CRISPR-associated helicase Cas3' [Hominenteromicrobium sp.]
MQYLAHKSEDGQRVQTIEEHLSGTASRCAAFAQAFGAGEEGRYAGSIHDLGKCSAEFQKRLNGDPHRPDHSTYGACVAFNRGRLPTALAVAGHHGGLPDLGNPQDLPNDPSLFGRLRRELPACFPPACPEPPAGGPPERIESQYQAAFFTRMLFSCLVDADFLDTEAFMLDGAVERGGYDTLDTLCRRLDAYTAKWENPTDALNRKRTEILHACTEKARSGRGLYTLTVPTGGGKTIASLSFALHHALENGLPRVIYVIPYTSIIEQNAEVFERILGAENVVQHHANVDWPEDAEEDLENPAMRRKQLAAENWDAPLIVTTAVQFFESLYANRSSRCRKLHNIANSVVIFDEVQMLPTGYLKPCTAAIAELVRRYNTTAVLCTATQPALEPLFREYLRTGGIEELCPRAADPCFDRYRLRAAGELTQETLAQRLNAEHQVLCVVNTRAQAVRLFEQLEPEGSFHLSTLMTPVHRKAVLDEIRIRLKEGKTCRVVSTSLIEAGVDVDFPAVYREEAGLDSILQAAGRCNREGKRDHAESVVWWFRLPEKTPPLFSVPVGVLRETALSFADLTCPEAIHAYFSGLLGVRAGGLDKAGVMQLHKAGKNGCRLPFREIADAVKLIDDRTTPVLIPIGGGADCLEQLRSGALSRALLRKAGRYSVSIYEQHLMRLTETGSVIRLADGLYALADTALYSDKTGLSLQADPGRLLFV